MFFLFSLTGSLFFIPHFCKVFRGNFRYKLYFGAYDEKNGGIEKRKDMLKKKHTFNTDFYGGIMEKECSNLLKNFFKKIRK